MLKARRVKRASPDDLYRSCKLGGDCIPDVQNKIENTTLADKLLQIFGSILYLGHLGIGTGRGSGGQYGYRPFGATTNKAPEITVTRPTVPINPLGGAEVIPLEVINPEAPSIIPLTDGLPDFPTVDTQPPTTEIAEIDITTQVQPTDNLPTSNQQPTVISTPDITVVDFQPGPSPPKRIALDVGFSPSDAIQLNIIPEPKYFDPNINVFVDPNIVAEDVGYEDIELAPISNIADFEIQEEAVPKSSTPLHRIESLIGQGKQLYNRFVEQVQTRNPNFLSRPSRLVTFDFENPAFEDEISLQFQQDVNEVAAAPDENFRDIISLSKPLYSETSEGLRVSRLGQKASMRTRSGLIIGPKVHYYMDISEISELPEIELHTFATFSGEANLIDAINESTFIDQISLENNTYPDELLEDILEENFNNGHIVISVSDAIGEHSEIPVPTLDLTVRPVIGDFSTPLIVNYPVYNSNLDSAALQPSATNVKQSYESSNYFIEPSLIKKRRKRKYIDF
uniref:Minor capsid protein L2 n=1 Tax=Human papillomavirus TaxID=10566 RepID=A0A385PIE9_9PAPI|nr:MAG: L2 protein [Human papillomavirus]